MDALKFLMEFNRMHHRYYADCESCPRGKEGCLFFDTQDKAYFEKFVADVEKWSRENPIKTRKQDFLDKYPYALLDSENVPKACCLELGYCKSCDYVAGTGCNKCWDEPVGDDEQWPTKN